MASDVKTIEDLFLEELRDLLDAEKQIAKAIPRMARATASEELKDAFEGQPEQARRHVERLERIFSAIGARSGGAKGKTIEGLIKRCDDIVNATEPGPVRDAGLIAAAQRVEHYEMAGYSAARTFAHLLGRREAAGLLERTLHEEKEADSIFAGIAEAMVNRKTAVVSGSGR